MTHELMIGNWVTYKGEIFYVSKVGESELEISNNDFWLVIYPYEFKDLSPIPITPEWLEKLGFEKFLGLDTIYKCGDVRVSYYFSKSVLKVSYKYSTIPDIAYIHQIQNLITILNGKR